VHNLSIDNCQNFAAKYLRSPGLKIAEVGGAGVGGSYRAFVNFPIPYTYMIFDLEPTKHVNVVLNSPEQWLLPEEHIGAYDVIISGQTLEHVRRPWIWIHQFVQLAKPNALVFLTAPNTWDFHEYPIDCWRIWPDGMRALFEDAGIEEIECFARHTDTVGIGRVR
jgi:hypothetical protein